MIIPSRRTASDVLDIPQDLLPITASNPPSTLDLTIQSYSTRSSARTQSRFISPRGIPSAEAKETPSVRIRQELKHNLQALNDQLEVLSVSTQSAASKQNTNSSSSNKDTVSTISIESTGKSSSLHLSTSDTKHEVGNRRTMSMSVDDPWTSDLLLDSAGLGMSGDHDLLGMNNYMASGDLMNTGKYSTPPSIPFNYTR